jgi:uncharacterized protein (DUF2141 family)
MKLYPIPFLAIASLAAGAASAADLTVTITEIRAPKGSIGVALFNSESAWKEQTKPFAGQRIAATGDKVTVRFTDLPPGTYAVQVMHDENDNGRLDTNLLGIPSEGFGFSGNSTAMRRAHFDEARFTVGSEDLTVLIHLR